MENQYISSFKIQLIKAEKKLKEVYADGELIKLLKKPDVKNCTFSCYKTWVFENYLLSTGNRISTAPDKRGIDKTSCHTFRHTFAKNWVMSGGDVFRLQKILEHSDLTVTREYVAMFGQDLQMNFEKFNLLDNLKGKNRDTIKM